MGYLHQPPAQFVDSQGRISGPVPEGPAVGFRKNQVGRPLPSDWTGIRLARGRGRQSEAWAAVITPSSTEVLAQDQIAAFAAFCRGEADAALVAEGMSDGVLSAKPEACGQRKVGLHTKPTWVVLFGIAAKPTDRGAVQAAERIREEMSAMIRSGRFASIPFNWGLVTSSQLFTISEFIEAGRRTRQLWCGLSALGLSWQTLRLRRARAAAESANRAKSARQLTASSVWPSCCGKRAFPLNNMNLLVPFVSPAKRFLNSSTTFSIWQKSSPASSNSARDRSALQTNSTKSNAFSARNGGERHRPARRIRPRLKRRRARR
ncbi:MAG: hypothetical protein NTV52_16635 [Acidobacteria bacterium]|nr:hypothetical protein [Acidobacteriota bacterium]